MSYIHEALKKAQQEKEHLSAKCAGIWSRKPGGSIIFKHDRLISLGIVVLAVAFSAYSWLQSIDSLPAGSDQKPAFYRATISPSSRVSTNRTPAEIDRGVATEPETAPFPEIDLGNISSQDSPFAQTQNQTVPSMPQDPVWTQQTVRNDPPSGDATTFYQQALAHQKDGQLQKAVDLYKAALKASPNMVSALNNLGTIYIQQKNLPEARKVLEKAIRTNADYVDPYYNLACLHAQQKDIGRSLFYLKKAISVDNAARQWAKTDEDLKNLRGHVEYEKIISGAENS